MKRLSEEISQQDLVDAGLIGGAGAKDRREKLGISLKHWFYKWKAVI